MKILSQLEERKIKRLERWFAAKRLHKNQKHRPKLVSPGRERPDGAKVLP